MTSKENWYDDIELPLQNLVKLLRNNGFNTISSCAHNPKPYVQMDWRRDDEILRVYHLLEENGFKNFTISAIWQRIGKNSQRHIEVTFYVKQKLIHESDIKEGIEGNRKEIINDL